MFSFTNCCRTMNVGTLMMMVVMMMMVMMMMKTSEAAAVPKAAKPHKKPTEEAPRMETVQLQLDPGVFSPIRTPRPLHNASISPWTYNVSRDESLFPPLLAEARCSLRGCLTSRGEEDQSLKSHPIMHQILVLRRVRPAGAEEGAGHAKGAGQGYHYRLESRTVAVGCTCVRPPVLIQQ